VNLFLRCNHLCEIPGCEVVKGEGGAKGRGGGGGGWEGGVPRGQRAA
jgi:hypothetical protein